MEDLRKRTIEKILALQDDSFRWGFDAQEAEARPNFLYYTPNYTSTYWTLLLLADLKAPVHNPQIEASIQLITEHFYDPEHGIFRLPGMSHFPIPCLNGNMLYLHHYFGTEQTERMDGVMRFFATYQRFDDGDFQTPKTYPYCSNASCYGKHTCYWGVTKLLRGISFLPKFQRSQAAQQLIENCIAFVLRHEVCFSSHDRKKFLHPDIGKLTFPNSWKSDTLEILWILAREGVRDRRTARSLELLRSKRKDGGHWELEKPMRIIVPIGKKNQPNAFITERANETVEIFRGLNA